MTRITATLLLLLALATLRAEPLSRAEAEELFEDGKSLFRQATAVADTDPDAARNLMQQALLRFQKLERDGEIRNGKLYYNLGNVHFHLDDLGRAILNYRRAREYIPDDPRLLQNLAFARAQRADAFAEPEQRQVLKTIFFLHYDFTLRTRSWIFAVAFAVFWSLLACRLFFRSPWLVRLAVVAAVLALGMFVSVAQTHLDRARSRPGVILDRTVVARLSDSESADPAFTEPLHAGTEFEITEDRGDWYEVRLSDGQTCWLPANSVGLVH
jgi:tetratricopeptide (TPR) repeat protein